MQITGTLVGVATGGIIESNPIFGGFFVFVWFALLYFFLSGKMFRFVDKIIDGRFKFRIRKQKRIHDFLTKEQKDELFEELKNIHIDDEWN